MIVPHPRALEDTAGAGGGRRFEADTSSPHGKAPPSTRHRPSYPQPRTSVGGRELGPGARRGDRAADDDDRLGPRGWGAAAAFGGGGTRFGGGGGTRFGGGGGFFFLGGNGVGLLVLVALVVAYVLIRNGRSRVTTSGRANHHRTAGRTAPTARPRSVPRPSRPRSTCWPTPTSASTRGRCAAARPSSTSRRSAPGPPATSRTLERILAPVVYGKWAEQLSGYAARGQSTVVEVLEGPDVQIVNVANRPGETEDTVTFRIVATLRDHVVDRRTGEVLTRKDRSTRPIEYWTLRKDGSGGWIVAGIEQAEDGHHHLTDALETDAWNQKSVGRDAVLEVAERTSPVRTADVLGLTNVSWADDADHAAADLSLVDARFDRSVLEVGIARFLEEWAMNDGSLDFTAVRTAHRTVMRTATVRSTAVRDLVSQDPVSSGWRSRPTGSTTRSTAGPRRSSRRPAHAALAGVPLHDAPRRRLARLDGHGRRGRRLSLPSGGHPLAGALAALGRPARSRPGRPDRSWRGRRRSTRAAGRTAYVSCQMVTADGAEAAYRRTPSRRGGARGRGRRRSGRGPRCCASTAAPWGGRRRAGSGHRGSPGRASRRARRPRGRPPARRSSLGIAARTRRTTPSRHGWCRRTPMRNRTRSPSYAWVTRGGRVVMVPPVG